VSRRRKPKAQLAKVIAFQGWRSRLEHDTDNEIESKSRRDYEEALRLSEERTPADPKEKLARFQTAVQCALQSELSMRVLFEDQLGSRFPISARNATWMHWSSQRLAQLCGWEEWCDEQMERFAEPARVYDLAEFRRFRDRLVASRTEARG
jgi:hypothetical protein